MDDRILKRKGFKQVWEAEHSLAPWLQRDNPGPEMKESDIQEKQINHSNGHTVH